MERISSLVIPDFGLRTNDVRYFSMESVVRGRDADRLKYLDLHGRWNLSGSSMPYISAAFNHLQRLNDARVPMRDIIDQPLNAIGMVGWTKSSTDAYDEAPKAATLPRRQPLRETPIKVVKEEEPREDVPYRSAGYGAAHERRKLSISEPRSRSASPTKMLRGGERMRDGGYGSASPSPRNNDLSDPYRPPHRTQGLSPRPSSRSRMYDSDYDPAFVTNSDNSLLYTDELRISTKENGLQKGLGYREKRMYNVSPRSLGSGGEDYSGSELDSPRNADEILMMAYHSKRAAESSPYRRSIRH